MVRPGLGDDFIGETDDCETGWCFRRRCVSVPADPQVIGPDLGKGGRMVGLTCKQANTHNCAAVRPKVFSLDRMSALRSMKITPARIRRMQEMLKEEINTERSKTPFQRSMEKRALRGHAPQITPGQKEALSILEEISEELYPSKTLQEHIHRRKLFFLSLVDYIVEEVTGEDHGLSEAELFNTGTSFVVENLGGETLETAIESVATEIIGQIRATQLLDGVGQAGALDTSYDYDPVQDGFNSFINFVDGVSTLGTCLTNAFNLNDPANVLRTVAMAFTELSTGTFGCTATYGTKMQIKDRMTVNTDIIDQFEVITNVNDWDNVDDVFAVATESQGCARTDDGEVMQLGACSCHMYAYHCNSKVDYTCYKNAAIGFDMVGSMGNCMCHDELVPLNKVLSGKAIDLYMDQRLIDNPNHPVLEEYSNNIADNYLSKAGTDVLNAEHKDSGESELYFNGTAQDGHYGHIYPLKPSWAAGSCRLHSDCIPMTDCSDTIRNDGFGGTPYTYIDYDVDAGVLCNYEPLSHPDSGVTLQGQEHFDRHLIWAFEGINWSPSQYNGEYGSDLGQAENVQYGAGAHGKITTVSGYDLIPWIEPRSHGKCQCFQKYKCRTIGWPENEPHPYHGYDLPLANEALALHQRIQCRKRGYEDWYYTNGDITLHYLETANREVGKNNDGLSNNDYWQWHVVDPSSNPHEAHLGKETDDTYTLLWHPNNKYHDQGTTNDFGTVFRLKSNPTEGGEEDGYDKATAFFSLPGLHLYRNMQWVARNSLAFNVRNPEEAICDGLCADYCPCKFYCDTDGEGGCSCDPCPRICGGEAVGLPGGFENPYWRANRKCTSDRKCVCAESTQAGVALHDFCGKYKYSSTSEFVDSGQAACDYQTSN